MRLSPFFKLYQIFNLKFVKFGKSCKFLNISIFFCCIFTKMTDFHTDSFAKILRSQLCKGCKSCRASKMLSNRILLQNFVLIQPRTSPVKNCKILLIFPILLILTPKPNRSTGRAGGARAPLPRRGAALAPRAHDRGPRAGRCLSDLWGGWGGGMVWFD